MESSFLQHKYRVVPFIVIKEQRFLNMFLVQIPLGMASLFFTVFVQAFQFRLFFLRTFGMLFQGFFQILVFFGYGVKVVFLSFGM